MEKDNIFSEEQEKELMDRINEIKNQTKKENNNNIETKEETNKKNITGIENVVVYQNNAKKTMKGKKGIAIALATIVLAGGIIFGVSKNNNNKQPIEPVEMVTAIDENGNEYQTDIPRVIEYIYEPYEKKMMFYVPINVNDYSLSDFKNCGLYWHIYYEMRDKAWEDGYDPNNPDDAICMYMIDDEIDSLELGSFDVKDNSFFYPKDGKYYIYYLTNEFPIKGKLVYDDKEKMYFPDETDFGVALDEYPVTPAYGNNF